MKKIMVNIFAMALLVSFTININAQEAKDLKIDPAIDSAFNNEKEKFVSDKGINITVQYYLGFSKNKDEELSDEDIAFIKDRDFYRRYQKGEEGSQPVKVSFEEEEDVVYALNNMFNYFEQTNNDIYQTIENTVLDNNIDINVFLKLTCTLYSAGACIQPGAKASESSLNLEIPRYIELNEEDEKSHFNQIVGRLFLHEGTHILQFSNKKYYKFIKKLSFEDGFISYYMLEAQADLLAMLGLSSQDRDIIIKNGYVGLDIMKATKLINQNQNIGSQREAYILFFKSYWTNEIYPNVGKWFVYKHRNVKNIIKKPGEKDLQKSLKETFKIYPLGWSDDDFKFVANEIEKIITEKELGRTGYTGREGIREFLNKI
ncbi:MAG: hypothetical protein HN833_04950 [Elusimicrobiaceae bacterium]|jgi:hypothetical protein|nr:hypothetical protein [Elusimicrobiaceae bacterium]MBT3954675.1 hypothetical protein [Elusimicrobiaceae bacterium]MBT4007851.1 hypothetical protein [Elusimicrobiaceae bacterium]MBT4402872.1 hypothetical protein [Elusimicrobiaceae bacterium]MBT4440106.1 hypothetical protein [Elusimicrobiaceae bacterium]